MFFFSFREMFLFFVNKLNYTTSECFRNCFRNFFRNFFRNCFRYHRNHRKHVESTWHRLLVTSFGISLLKIRNSKAAIFTADFFAVCIFVCVCQFYFIKMLFQNLSFCLFKTIKCRSVQSTAEINWSFIAKIIILL